VNFGEELLISKIPNASRLFAKIKIEGLDGKTALVKN